MIDSVRRQIIGKKICNVSTIAMLVLGVLFSQVFTIGSELHRMYVRYGSLSGRLVYVHSSRASVAYSVRIGRSLRGLCC